MGSKPMINIIVIGFYAYGNNSIEIIKNSWKND